MNQPQLFTYEVVAEFPHDPKAFTQGLEYYEWCTSQGGTCAQLFYESTGLLGRSSVREVDVATGRVLRARALPKSDFGEGLTRIRDTLYQVTWQTNRAWSYDIDNFEHAKEIRVRDQKPLKTTLHVDDKYVLCIVISLNWVFSFTYYLLAEPVV